MEKENAKKYFPIFLDLSEKQIVVIGGGTIAGRRARTLCEFTDHVKVVAPEIGETIQQLLDEKQIEWMPAAYERAHLTGADLVVAATNRPEVNHKVLSDCRAVEQEENRRILVSVADNRNLCDFYFPSIVQTKDAVIGINSGGSPKHTKQIRQKIEEALGEDSIY